MLACVCVGGGRFYDMLFARKKRARSPYNGRQTRARCVLHAAYIARTDEGNLMRELPANQLNPRIKSVWRINDAIWIAICFLCCFVPFAIVAVVDPDAGWSRVACVVVAIFYAALLVLCLVILPPIRYARWRYEVSPDYLDIARGIVWRKRFIIPFIRVQNTDTRQGPILRAFGLSSVTVSTAAGEHEIPGLGSEEAELLRDRAAELARLAREDV